MNTPTPVDQMVKQVTQKQPKLLHWEQVRALRALNSRPFMGLVITGAFGRDTSMEDWRAGKEFRIGFHGAYCSKRDIPMFLMRGVSYLEFRNQRDEWVATLYIDPELDEIAMNFSLAMKSASDPGF